MRIRSENDPRVQFRLRHGENPTSTDHRVAWLFGGLAVAMVVAVALSGIVELIRDLL